ncbi:hypothetical protein [Tepidibacter mesophilus]|uniref:hypothetical protein n=1 Tax=Tepidibacter mesophilus TaxID=655607 RepID=UPI000C073B62|nr:hypothetical protein [Tepidibacter mesophilus]
MGQTITGNNVINKLMRNSEYYIHQINLPSIDFTGGNLTFGGDDVLSFGTSKEEAFIIYTYNGRTVIRHRLKEPKLIGHYTDSMDVMDTKACLINVWIEGSALNLEFRNHSGEIADINKSVYYSVHK